MQHAHGAAAPVAKLLREPLHDGMRMEHAAIEQHGIGQVTLVTLLDQKLGQMA